MRVYLIKSDSDTKKLSSIFFPQVFYLETGDNVKYEDVRRGENGKPLPINDYYFNISHSGNYWCIAFSDSECGIDIEINRQLKAHISKKILFPSENLIDDNILRNWVLKEAYAKMIGVGISVGLNNINMADIFDKCAVTDLSSDDYICYAVGADSVSNITKMSWSNGKLF